MKKLKQVAIAFTVVTAATGAMAADKYKECFEDKESQSKICLTETSRNTGSVFTSVNAKAQVTDTKTGKACKATGAVITLDKQGNRTGYALKGLDCPK